jgi:hypothetical protein
MGKPAFLHILFGDYSANLHDLRPDLVDIFICPICFKHFTRADIDTKQLSDGHIWPKGLRQKSRNTVKQRVLLCTECNNTAGGLGDAQLGILEQVKDAEKLGVFYGFRRLEFIPEPGEKPINLRMLVSKGEDPLTFHIEGKFDNKRRRLVGSSPEDTLRFHELVQSGIRSTVIVHPNQNLKPELVAPAWFMAAYLLAFYHLGYRYIGHPGMAPVRKYILNSFDKVAAKNRTLPNEDDFQIREFHDQVFTDPVLNIVIPLDNATKVYLEVNFLQYSIRLPFHFVPVVMEALILKQMPDFYKRFPSIQVPDTFLYMPVLCTVLEPHECIFNYLMGKPIPEI